MFEFHPRYESLCKNHFARITFQESQTKPRHNALYDTLNRTFFDSLPVLYKLLRQDAKRKYLEHPDFSSPIISSPRSPNFLALRLLRTFNKNTLLITLAHQKWLLFNTYFLLPRPPKRHPTQLLLLLQQRQAQPQSRPASPCRTKVQLPPTLAA